jgi:hypothetical protein
MIYKFCPFNDRTANLHDRYHRNQWWMVGPTPRPNPTFAVSASHVHPLSVTIKHCKAELDTHSYPYHTTMTRARAAFVISRAQRHLPSYTHCTLDELLKFHADRGLPSSVLGEVRRAKLRGHLAKRLEEADEERRFESFLSLPPELRCLVYEMAFEGVPAVGTGGEGKKSVVATLPPICVASKEVCEETLGVLQRIRRRQSTEVKEIEKAVGAKVEATV